MCVYVCVCMYVHCVLVPLEARRGLMYYGARYSGSSVDLSKRWWEANLHFFCCAVKRFGLTLLEERLKMECIYV